MLKRFGLSAAAVMTASALLSASAATFWTVATQADFLKGDVDSLSIDSDGRVFLGPAGTQVAETAAPFLWTLLPGPDGVLWAGTGNEGQVLKIGRDGKSSTFFDAPEMEVHALAPAPGGGLYVATSPDGRIYQVGPDGTSKTFFDPDDKYIWALAVAPDGALFAATGEKGNIYRITPDGKGSVFYKTNTTNVVSLAMDKSGNLLAGTESPGRIFRIDATGKAFVLVDSPFKEIHALKLAADGTIYAAAFSGGSSGDDRSGSSVSLTPPEPPPSAPVPTVSAEITGITVVDATSGGSSAGAAVSTRSRNPKGAIYRIRPDGLWDTLWEATDDWPFDLLLENDGSILVGTGKEGKLFRLSGDPATATLLARAAARQITALVRDSSGRTLAATSNPGKVVAFTPARAASGTYESDIRDAGTVATWGAIRWRASAAPGEVELFTRSGNTSMPDETWSAWSKAYTRSDGEPIASPNARYLQWRAVLKASAQPSQNAGPILTSVTTAYLPRNLRPMVTSITVHPAGTVFQRPFSTGEMEIAGFEDNTSDGRNPAQPNQSSGPGSAPPGPALGRKVYQKGLQTFVWKAEDENDDRLQFDVPVPAGGRDGLEAAEARSLGSDPRVGHDVGARRHLLRQGHRDRRAVELPRHGAGRRIRKRQLRHRQLSSGSRGAVGHARGRARYGEVCRARRAVGGAAGGIFARREQMAGGVSGGRNPRLPKRAIRGLARGRRRRAFHHHPRDRCDEQRGDGRRRDQVEPPARRAGLSSRPRASASA